MDVMTLVVVALFLAIGILIGAMVGSWWALVYPLVLVVLAIIKATWMSGLEFGTDIEHFIGYMLVPALTGVIIGIGARREVASRA